MSLLMANRSMIKPIGNAIPTFIMIGDSLCDGRLNIGATTSYSYFSEYANDIYNADKLTCKIFDNRGGSNTFLTLNLDNSQVLATNYNCGYEQVLAWELAQFYGITEFRIIKYGVGGTYAYSSWQPGQLQMNAFESDYADALAAASTEGVTLDIIGIITFLGTNDGIYDYMAAALETSLTTIINHIRTNITMQTTPVYVTSATAGNFEETCREQQISLCENLSQCYYVDIARMEVVQTHHGFIGVFAGSLEIANSILVNGLSQSDIHEKYNFHFDTNYNGTYTIKTLLYGEVNYYIDWGDGNTTLVTSNNTNYSHTYSSSATKTIKINTFTPWSIFQLTLNSSLSSAIVGELDMSQLTGMRDFVVSTNNSALTSLIPPIDNFSNYTGCGNIFSGSGLSSIDLTRFVGNNGLGIAVYNNASLTSFADNSNGKTILSISFINNDSLVDLDISTLTNLSGGVLYVRSSLLLQTVTIGDITSHDTIIMDNNPVMTNILGYPNSLLSTRGVTFSNNDLTRSLVDSMINYVWQKCQDDATYRNIANKSYAWAGNNGASGTYDATTDWSGGLPTSPQAKRWDLTHNILNTYNFTTFTV